LISLLNLRGLPVSFQSLTLGIIFLSSFTIFPLTFIGAGVGFLSHGLERGMGRVWLTGRVFRAHQRGPRHGPRAVQAGLGESEPQPRGPSRGRGYGQPAGALPVVEKQKCRFDASLLHARELRFKSLHVFFFLCLDAGRNASVRVELKREMREQQKFECPQ